MDQRYRQLETLPPEQPFEFSQASLQDDIDCPRRFQLRYIRRLRWPAPQSEPLKENEAHIRRGERFHRLAQQALTGLPPERLARVAGSDPDPALARWWGHFAALLPELLTGKPRAEVMLSAPIGQHRLLAKYDLIQMHPDGRAVIYDWKTHLIRPRRGLMENRMQTRVYPTLLAHAGSGFNDGRAIVPELIEMVYWFAEFPDRPERFTFDTPRLESDWRELDAHIAAISARSPQDFPLAEDEKRCRFCVYRSYCDRGIQAGLLAESEEDPEPAEFASIDFDQIGEIAF